jgi:hypothetical protein
VKKCAKKVKRSGFTIMDLDAPVPKSKKLNIPNSSNVNGGNLMNKIIVLVLYQNFLLLSQETNSLTFFAHSLKTLLSILFLYKRHFVSLLDAEIEAPDFGVCEFNDDLFNLPEPQTIGTSKTVTVAKKSKLSTKKDDAGNGNEDVGVCMRTYRKNVMAWFEDKQPEEPLVNKNHIQTKYYYRI